MVSNDTNVTPECEPRASTPLWSIKKYRQYLDSIGLNPRTVTAYLHKVLQTKKIVGKYPVKWVLVDVMVLITSPEWTNYSPSSRAVTRCALRRLWEMYDRNDLLTILDMLKDENQQMVSISTMRRAIDETK